MLQVDQDDDGISRTRSQQRVRSHHTHHQERADPLGDDRQMVEDARLVSDLDSQHSAGPDFAL